MVMVFVTAKETLAKIPSLMGKWVNLHFSSSAIFSTHSFPVKQLHSIPTDTLGYTAYGSAFSNILGSSLHLRLPFYQWLDKPPHPFRDFNSITKSHTLDFLIDPFMPSKPLPHGQLLLYQVLLMCILSPLYQLLCANAEKILFCYSKESWKVSPSWC